MTTYQQVSITIPDVISTQGNGRRSVGAVGLLWRSDQPFTVQLLASGNARQRFIRWTLDRRILAEGLAGPAGMGDYSVMPDITQTVVPRVELILSGNTAGVGCNACLALPVVLLEEFLERTYETVPLGAEQLDVDPSQIGGEAA